MFKRLLCVPLPSLGTPVELDEQEGYHAVRVLRLKTGESVELLDGDGNSIQAVLEIQGKRVLAHFQSQQSPRPRSLAMELVPATLVIGVLKGEAMEWVIEKAVEIGIQKVVPLLTEFSVVNLKKKGVCHFHQRWQKIADQALKQCGRLKRLLIEEPKSFSEYFTENSMVKTGSWYWCDEHADPTFSPVVQILRETSFQDMRIIIGPEGGWSVPERECLEKLLKQPNSPLKKVSLSPFILRSETAALFAMSLLGAFYWDLDRGRP